MELRDLPNGKGMAIQKKKYLKKKEKSTRQKQQTGLWLRCSLWSVGETVFLYQKMYSGKHVPTVLKVTEGRLLNRDRGLPLTAVHRLSHRLQKKISAS